MARKPTPGLLKYLCKLLAIGIVGNLIFQFIAVTLAGGFSYGWNAIGFVILILIDVILACMFLGIAWLFDGVFSKTKYSLVAYLIMSRTLLIIFAAVSSVYCESSICQQSSVKIYATLLLAFVNILQIFLAVRLTNKYRGTLINSMWAQ